jgi:hypothetical protein
VLLRDKYGSQLFDFGEDANENFSSLHNYNNNYNNNNSNNNNDENNESK